MAYHEVAMWEILSVLERLRRRESKAAITRATGRSRSTVRRYERVARELGWTPEGDAPTEALAADVGRRLHPASDRDPGDIEAELLPHLEQLRAWLTPGPTEKRGLRLTKVHQLLTRTGHASRTLRVGAENGVSVLDSVATSFGHSGGQGSGFGDQGAVPLEPGVPTPGP